MARYFFDWHWARTRGSPPWLSDTGLDTEGTEFGRAEEVRLAAIRYAGELMVHYPERLKGNAARLSVLREDGELQIVIAVAIEDERR